MIIETDNLTTARATIATYAGLLACSRHSRHLLSSGCCPGASAPYPANPVGELACNSAAMRIGAAASVSSWRCEQDRLQPLGLNVALTHLPQSPAKNQEICRKREGSKHDG